MKNTRESRAVEQFSCPTCKARPGQPCAAPPGQPAMQPMHGPPCHPLRRQLLSTINRIDTQSK